MNVEGWRLGLYEEEGWMWRLYKGMDGCGGCARRNDGG